MTKISRVFDVRAAPEEVYRLISAPEKWSQWATFVNQATSAGLKAHWVYRMGGMKVESNSEVTEAVENRIYAFHQAGGFMKSGETRLEIEPTKTGSRVAWTVQYELPYSYLGKLVDRLKAGKTFEKAIDESIKGLKSRLER